jgi:hypothetical protein
MHETATQIKDQSQANLIALHRQLQDMASKGKWSNQNSRNSPRPMQASTLVVRGK